MSALTGVGPDDLLFLASLIDESAPERHGSDVIDAAFVAGYKAAGTLLRELANRGGIRGEETP